MASRSYQRLMFPLKVLGITPAVSILTTTLLMFSQSSQTFQMLHPSSIRKGSGTRSARHPILNKLVTQRGIGSHSLYLLANSVVTSRINDSRKEEEPSCIARIDINSPLLSEHAPFSSNCPQTFPSVLILPMLQQRPPACRSV